MNEGQTDILKAAHDKMIDDMSDHTQVMDLMMNPAITNKQLMTIKDHPKATYKMIDRAKERLTDRGFGWIGRKEPSIDEGQTVRPSAYLRDSLGYQSDPLNQSESLTVSPSHSQSETALPTVSAHLIPTLNDSLNVSDSHYMLAEMAIPVAESTNSKDDAVLHAAHQQLSKPGNDIDVQEDLALHSADPIVHDRLASHNSVHVRGALATNPHISSNVLNYLSHDSYAYVRANVAAHAYTDHITLERMANDAHAGVRHEVAKNRNTPSDTLQRLFHDDSSSSVAERARLTYSDKTGERLISRLDRYPLKESDDNILRTAHQKLVKGQPRIDIADNLARFSDDPIVHQRLAKHRSHDVRASLAFNSSVHPDILADLSKDSSSWVRMRVACSHRTHPDVLERLSTDPHHSTRQAVAWNKNTPAHVIERLSNDPVRYVANSAQQNQADRPHGGLVLEDGEIASVSTSSGALAYDGQLSLGKGSIKSKPKRRRLRQFLKESDDLLKNAHKKISKTDINDDVDARSLLPLAKSSTDPEVLHNIATAWSNNWMHNSELHNHVASNIHTSPSTLHFLAGHELASVRGHVATNRNTSIDTLKMLVSDDIDYVRHYADSRLKRYPIKESDDLLKNAHLKLSSDNHDPSAKDHHALLDNPLTRRDPEIQKNLANSPNSSIRGWVAAHTKDHDILHKLSKDDVWHVKHDVLTNPDTPAHVLDSAARQVPRDEVSHTHNRTTRLITRHNNVSSDTLHYLADSHDFDTVGNVAEHRNTSAETLHKIITRPETDNDMFWAKAEAEAMRHPNVTHETLRHVMKDYQPKELSQFLANHSKAHPDDLNTLANHALSSVRERVFHNPNTPHETKQKLADRDKFVDKKGGL